MAHPICLLLNRFILVSASPGFEGKPFDARLDPNDALFVDVIHTGKEIHMKLKLSQFVLI